MSIDSTKLKVKLEEPEAVKSEDTQMVSVKNEDTKILSASKVWMVPLLSYLVVAPKDFKAGTKVDICQKCSSRDVKNFDFFLSFLD